MEELKPHQEFELAKICKCIEGDLTLPRRMAIAFCTETRQRLEKNLEKLGQTTDFWVQFGEEETVTATEMIQVLETASESRELADEEVLVLLHQGLQVLYLFENHLEANNVPP
ncbi:MAG: hypothetical protein ACO4CS_15315 [bacterium]